MKSIRSDVWLAFCVIALAAVYLYMDMHLPEAHLSDPLGPKAFPALIGAGLIVSALIVLFETRGKKRSNAAETAAALPVAETTDEHEHAELAQLAEPAPKQRPFVLIGMVGWTAAYYLCFERAGYLLATSVFLFGLLCFFNRQRFKTNLAIALGVTVVFDLLFSQLLGVPVPTGLLPF